MNFHKLVFIGLLFQFFDFKFGSFDIMPDFIEYVIVAYAFSKLDYRYAKEGFISALLLMIFSFFNIFNPSLLDINTGSNLFTITSIVFGMLQIFYFACIFAVSNQIVQDSSRKFPTVFLAGIIIVNLIASLSIHLSVNLASTLVLLSMVAFFICYMYLFIFLWKRIGLQDKKQAEKSTDLLDADIELE
ncbi:hypothetical protein [Solibacillus sp.]|uniref:hypothetical protein n=1 Tax=Solibacillus sp. TaxID=1909654 RepID=UPI0033163E7D